MKSSTDAVVEHVVGTAKGLLVGASTSTAVAERHSTWAAAADEKEAGRRCYAAGRVQRATRLMLESWIVAYDTT